MLKKALIIGLVLVAVVMGAVVILDVGIRIYSWVHADPRAIFHGDDAHTFRLVDAELIAGKTQSEVIQSLTKLGFEYCHELDEGARIVAMTKESGAFFFRTVSVECRFDNAGLLVDHEAKVWFTGW